MKKTVLNMIILITLLTLCLPIAMAVGVQVPTIQKSSNLLTRMGDTPLPDVISIPVVRTGPVSAATCSTIISAVPVPSGHVGNISGEQLSSVYKENIKTSGNESLNETVTATLVHLPLSFIPNDGQSDPAVLFMVKSSAASFLFTSNNLIFRVQNSTNSPNLSSLVITQAFIGSNTSALVRGEDILPGTANFFIGNDPENWHPNLSTYGAVRYHDLYPGIDLLYRGNGSVLKREFFIRPGSEPGLIRMKYSGADSLSLDPSGALNITVDHVSMTESLPVCYQDKNGNRIVIGAHYVLTQPDEVRIEPDTYDPAYPLVIDPDLTFSSYLGGTGSDYGNGIAVDSLKNIYITGETAGSFPIGSSTGLPPYQPDFGGGTIDTFVTKLSSTGSDILYSTYLGGSGDSSGTDIKVDSSGNAYVTGHAYSDNFPVTPYAVVPESYFATLDVAFVTKLNPTGSALVFSGKIGGGNLRSYGEGIAIDSSGNVYLTGYGSLNMTNNLTQPLLGSGEGFVAKINPSCTSLLYGRLIGAGMLQGGKDIAVDPSGNAYVTGTTDGSLPTTAGAFQTRCGGRTDAFVMKLNTAGSVLYSTMLGGAGYDDGIGISVNSAGNAYVTGRTRIGGVFPTTPGAYQTIRGSGDDVFVTKLSPSGDSLVYSTYIGGAENEQGYDIAVDPDGNAYLTGYTRGGPYNVTSGAYQIIFGGGLYDAFISKLNPSGSSLLYSSYLGGSGNDVGNGIALDSAGVVYLTGQTSGSFPTSGTYGGGDYDAFIAKFSIPAGVAPTITSITPTSGYNTGTLATTIKGSNFRSGVSAKLTRGSTTKTGTVSSLTGTQFKAKFALLGAPAGTYNLVITNTDITTVTKTGYFTVKSEKYSYVRKWGKKGTGNTQFTVPYGIAIDSKGYIYVADTSNNRILKFSSTGVFKKKWGIKGTGNGQFSSPRDVAVDKSGNVYVADTGNYRIQKFTSSGSFIRKWGKKGTGNTQFNSPYGVGVDKSGNVYVADTGNNRIMKFSSNSAYKAKWGKKGNTNGKFSSPQDVAVDKYGYIYVADTGNHQIQKLSSGGKYQIKWGGKGTANGKFNTPSGIAIDANNFVYVADTNNNRIQKFSSTGSYLTKWGTTGPGNTQFKTPARVAVSSTGLVDIADTGNNRVAVWKKPVNSVSAETVEIDVNLTKASTIVKSFNAPDMYRPSAAVPVVDMPVMSKIRPMLQGVGTDVKNLLVSGGTNRGVV